MTSVEDDFFSDEMTLGQEVQPFETPSFGLDESWHFPTLYKMKSAKSGRYVKYFWMIEWDAESQQLQTVSGILGTDKPRILPIHAEENKSGRNLLEQVLLQARRRYEDKQREAYSAEGESKIREVLPAKAYIWIRKAKLEEIKEWNKLSATQRKSRTWNYISTEKNPEGYPADVIKDWSWDMPIKKNGQWKVINRFPVWCQVKIDGMRNLARQLNTGEIQFRSSSGRVRPHFEHIKKELEILYRYLPAGCQVDGEIWSPDVNFQTLASLIRTEKTVHPKQWLTSFYMFDLITPNPKDVFEDRYAILYHAFQAYARERDPSQRESLFIVGNFVADNEDEILTYHEEFVSLGFEGIMIRKIAGPSPTAQTISDSIYASERSDNVLKYKAFDDGELEIVDVTEGTGSHAGLAMFVVHDPEVLDEKKAYFQVTPKMSHEARADIFKHPRKVIGKMVTIRYQGRSEDNVMRFPIAVSIRDYE